MMTHTTPPNNQYYYNPCPYAHTTEFYVRIFGADLAAVLTQSPFARLAAQPRFLLPGLLRSVLSEQQPPPRQYTATQSLQQSPTTTTNHSSSCFCSFEPTSLTSSSGSGLHAFSSSSSAPLLLPRLSRNSVFSSCSKLLSLLNLPLVPDFADLNHLFLSMFVFHSISPLSIFGLTRFGLLPLSRELISLSSLSIDFPLSVFHVCFGPKSFSLSLMQFVRPKLQHFGPNYFSSLSLPRVN